MMKMQSIVQDARIFDEIHNNLFGYSNKAIGCTDKAMAVLKRQSLSLSKAIVKCKMHMSFILDIKKS